MRYRNSWKACFLYFVFVVINLVHRSTAIKCNIGYGQRGLEYGNEFAWVRDCPNARYCWEAVTTDVNKVQQLIAYPWFFIRSCGGDYGTPLDWHPYKGHPSSIRQLGMVKINITAPAVITGQGGSAQFDLMFSCRKDLCTKPSATTSAASHITHISTSIIMMAVFTMSYFLLV